MAGTKLATEALVALVAETVLTAASDAKNSLEGIDVTGLQDRATCYVRGLLSTYRYFDSSVVAPAYPFVIAPAVGPGRWILISTDLAPSGTLPFIQTTLAAEQVFGDLTNATIIMDTIAVDGGIPYDTNTGEYTLTEFGTYEMEFYGLWGAFNAAGDQAVYRWTNAVNAELVARTDANVYPPNTNLGRSSQPVTKVIYTAPVGGAVVKLRADNGNGAATLIPSGSFATVRRIA